MFAEYLESVALDEGESGSKERLAALVNLATEEEVSVSLTGGGSGSGGGAIFFGTDAPVPYGGAVGSPAGSHPELDASEREEDNESGEHSLYGGGGGGGVDYNYWYHQQWDAPLFEDSEQEKKMKRVLKLYGVHKAKPSAASKEQAKALPPQMVC